MVASLYSLLPTSYDVGGGCAGPPRALPEQWRRLPPPLVPWRCLHIVQSKGPGLRCSLPKALLSCGAALPGRPGPPACPPVTWRPCVRHVLWLQCTPSSLASQLITLHGPAVLPPWTPPLQSWLSSLPVDHTAQGRTGWGGGILGGLETRQLRVWG